MAQKKRDKPNKTYRVFRIQKNKKGRKKINNPKLIPTKQLLLLRTRKSLKKVCPPAVYFMNLLELI